MNYELAKELREKGFWAGKDFVEEDLQDFGINGLQPVPTLEELIENCETVLGSSGVIEIYRYYDETCIPKGGARWYACNKVNTLSFGTTPTEAVARLWLALNKKI